MSETETDITIEVFIDGISFKGKFSKNEIEELCLDISHDLIKPIEFSL